MNLYKTTYTDATNGGTRALYAGSQADAGKTRAALRKDKHTAIETKDVDVPTNKAGLLTFLNGLSNPI